MSYNNNYYNKNKYNNNFRKPKQDVFVKKMYYLLI